MFHTPNIDHHFRGCVGTRFQVLVSVLDIGMSASKDPKITTTKAINGERG